jgi:hypothetical protein
MRSASRVRKFGTGYAGSSFCIDSHTKNILDGVTGVIVSLNVQAWMAANVGSHTKNILTESMRSFLLPTHSYLVINTTKKRFVVTADN